MWETTPTTPSDVPGDKQPGGGWLLVVIARGGARCILLVGIQTNCVFADYAESKDRHEKVAGAAIGFVACRFAYGLSHVDAGGEIPGSSPGLRWNPDHEEFLWRTKPLSSRNHGTAGR